MRIFNKFEMSNAGLFFNMSIYIYIYIYIYILFKIAKHFRTRVHLQNKIKETRSALYIKVYKTLCLSLLHTHTHTHTVTLLVRKYYK